MQQESRIEKIVQVVPTSCNIPVTNGYGTHRSPVAPIVLITGGPTPENLKRPYKVRVVCNCSSAGEYCKLLTTKRDKQAPCEIVRSFYEAMGYKL
jgi:hypothetical protein